MGNKLHLELYKELRQLIKEYEFYVDRSNHIKYYLKDIDYCERSIILILKRELRNIKFEICCLNSKIKKLKNKIKLCQRSFDKSKSI